MRPRVIFPLRSGLCLPVLLSLAAGCTTTINTVERAQPAAQRQMVDDKRILTDAGLDRRVRIMAVNEKNEPGGLLKIQVELFNTTRSLQRFNYKFEWFDANGILITSPAAAFLPRQIEGKESLFLTATAPTSAAKDFRLKLIEN